MSRALTFLEEVERDAASVSLSDRPTITPAALFPTRHVTRRCPECGCPNGGHTSVNCPGNDE